MNKLLELLFILKIWDSKKNTLKLSILSALRSWWQTYVEDSCKKKNESKKNKQNILAMKFQSAFLDIPKILATD